MSSAPVLTVPGATGRPRDRASLAARALLAGLAALVGLRLFFPPPPLAWPALPLAWFGCAALVGVAVGRWWALLLAPLPLLGRWYTIATGPEYLTYGENGALLATLLFSFLSGLWLAGATLGVAGARAARIAIPLLLVGLLGGLALDRARGGGVLRPPAPIEVRRYAEAEVRALAADLPFAIYAAPADQGLPSYALRAPLSAPGGGPTETVTLIYCDDRCRRRSEVQLLSAPHEYGVAVRRALPDRGTPVAIGAVTWEVAVGGPLPGGVEARALLDDAYVQIRAPDRATFEQVAAGLWRVGR